MWEYLPEARRHEYAETEEEARRWLEASVQAQQTDARRPPELSTRDNVARAIYTEVKEGRGSPHGGVFLDISYLPAERVKKKLPSMYMQFLELADVDITKGPMEVGPTCHYIMGGVRVDVADPDGFVQALDELGDVAAVVLCVEPPDAGIARTCLERGIDLVDIGATLRLLEAVADLHDVAVAAGATAVLSVGVAPGR